MLADEREDIYHIFIQISEMRKWEIQSHTLSDDKLYAKTGDVLHVRRPSVRNTVCPDQHA